jgi:hypothetical protein
MKTTWLSTLLIAGGTVICAAAEFQPPIRLTADGVPIRVDSPGYACPCWTDIDGDGKKDLLVGQYDEGKIRVYKNLGDGKLAAGYWLQADGSDAKIPDIWCCTSPTPQLADLDGDGNRDILSGSYSRWEKPMAGLFHVLWGQTDGTFKKAQVLNGTDGKPLTIPIRGQSTEDSQWVYNFSTRPFAVDWDGDGHLDLVAGNIAGTFDVFKGEGKGKFSQGPEELKLDGQPLTVPGYRSDPFVIDWDGDGDLDLLSGSYDGGVQLAENIAGPGKLPQLSAFKTLIEHGPEIEYGQILYEQNIKAPLGSTRISVDDFNADGKLDIFVGDLVRLVAPADNLTEKEYQDQFAAWQKSLEEAAVIKNTEKEDKQKQQDANERVQTLLKQRDEFMKYDSTGFVWLYLQK